MCNKCREVGNRHGLNPEPTEIQLATYARLVRERKLPKTQPRWITEHQRLTGQRLEQFAPDFRVVLPNKATTITKPAVRVPASTWNAPAPKTLEEYVEAFDRLNGLKPVKIRRAA